MQNNHSTATLLPTTPEVYKTSLKSPPFKLAVHDSKAPQSYWGRGIRKRSFLVLAVGRDIATLIMDIPSSNSSRSSFPWLS
jgi:hypothetical protein